MFKECPSCGNQYEEWRSKCPRCAQDVAAIAFDSAHEFHDWSAGLKEREEAAALDRKGANLFCSGNLEEAEKLFRKAIQLNPKLATAHGNLGHIFQERGMYAQAVPWLEKALSLDPRLEGVPDALDFCRKAAQERVTPPVQKAITQIDETSGWIVSVDGGQGDALALTATGCAIIGTRFGRHLDSDIWILGLKQDGDVIWQEAFGGRSLDQGCSVASLANGDLAILGETRSFSKRAACCVLRLDTTGRIIWSKVYGVKKRDLEPAFMIRTQDGGLVVAGSSSCDNPHSNEAFLLRLDGKGKILWQKILGEGDYGSLCDATSIVELANGDLAFTGRIEDHAGKCHYYVVRCGGDGRILWARAYTKHYVDLGSAPSICSDANGCLVVVGNVGIARRMHNLWALMLDGDGNIVWQRMFGAASGSQSGNSVLAMPDGTFCIVGIAADPFYKCLIAKISAQGTPLWASTLGDDRYSVLGHGIAMTVKGQLLVTGGMVGSDESRLMVVSIQGDGFAVSSERGHLKMGPLSLKARDTNATPVDIRPGEGKEMFKSGVADGRLRKTESEPVFVGI